MMMNQGALMMQPGMPEMPPMVDFDEDSFRAQLQVEKEAKDRERHRKGRKVALARAAKRDFHSSSNCIYWLGAVNFFGLGAIGLLLCGNSWGYASFAAGVGFQTATISTGMFEVEISIVCTDMIGANLCENYVGQIGGTHSINHVTGVLCSVPGVNQGCHLYPLIQHASTVLLIAYCLCCISLAVSLISAYFYWFVEHHPRYRQTAMLWGTCGPFSMLFGMVMWKLIMPDLAQFPVWATPASLQIIVPFDAPPVGRDAVYAGIVAIFLLFANSALPCYLTEHPQELADEDAREDAIEQIQERVELMREQAANPYGSMMQSQPANMMYGVQSGSAIVGY